MTSVPLAGIEPLQSRMLQSESQIITKTRSDCAFINSAITSGLTQSDGEIGLHQFKSQKDGRFEVPTFK